MKRIQILLLIPLMILGCKSPKNLIKDGNYDEAVKILVKKLSVNPDKEKNIIYLKQSYKAVNQKDIDRINYLRKTGQPNIWYEVYQHYDKLKNRQDLVKALPPDVLSQIGFKSVDYDNDVIEAKKKAAAYLYAHAQMLLKKEDRQSARQAYEELLKVSKLYNDYKDVDALLRRALVMGTNYVLFKMQNKSGVLLPLSFENELMSISLADLDRTFINYDSKAVKGRNYDYNIVVNIRVINVSPEQLDRNHFTESKKIQDGWKYKYDKDGKIVKDSTGKAIKIPKYKIIECFITEVHQRKTATISGSVDYINNHTSQLINTTPVSATSVFEHHSAIFNGNLDACTPQTLLMLNTTTVPFPSNAAMILDAGDKLKSTIKDIIWDDDYLVE
ncbi:MAG: hypothetical protein K8R46_10810 [Pirellulales bacterium]|nr:hypothetical protein [Pirellulales bacterium]